MTGGGGGGAKARHKEDQEDGKEKEGSVKIKNRCKKKVVFGLSTHPIAPLFSVPMSCYRMVAYFLG